MKKLVAFFNLAAMCAVMALPPAAQGNRSDQGRGPEFVPGEMLVQFRGGTDESEVNRVLSRINGRAAEVVRSAMANRDGRGDLVLARFPNMIAFEAARRDVESEYSVEFAEQNWIYTHQAVSNDSYFTNGSLWGMYGASTSPSNTYGSGAAAAWTRGADCSNVYVGIIDEGYMYNHVELAANAGVNPGETAGNGVDDDGNGYIDDVYGWDFDGNNNSVFDGTTDDHGTHVAGTIGAVGGNGVGVAGMCWSVKLMNAKFLGRRGGTTANAVKAVDYFTDLKTRHGLNFVATNNSWGGGGASSALQSAIERANAANILFVAAAGNSSLNCETSSCYPAEYPNANVIAVASITSTGGMSSFSNYGSSTIDIGAPGSGIWSTVPISSKGQIASGLASYSGTSMACPHVAGAAALYKARNPSASAAQIKTAILSSASATSSLNGRVATNGRLNVSSF
jgi:subtilisin family serine protease